MRHSVTIETACASLWIMVVRGSISVVAAIGLVLGACAQGPTLPPTESGASNDAISEFRPITDIPIPTSAKLDTERSIILSGRDRWTGRLVLAVGLSAEEAFAFYQNGMARFGWTPVMSVQAKTSVLTFTRGDRAATVEIERQTLGGSRIMVTIAPRQPLGEAATVESAPLSPGPGR